MNDSINDRNHSVDIRQPNFYYNPLKDENFSAGDAINISTSPILVQDRRSFPPSNVQGHNSSYRVNNSYGDIRPTNANLYYNPLKDGSSSALQAVTHLKTAFSNPKPVFKKEAEVTVKVEDLVDEPAVEGLENCICMSEAKPLICTNCLHLMKGRIMNKNCPVHPNHIHLMDFACCPSCRCTDTLQVL